VYSNNILVYVSHHRFIPRANTSQQRWSIVEFLRMLRSACCRGTLWISFSFLIDHKNPPDNDKMSRFFKPQGDGTIYYWTNNKPSLGDGFTTSTAEWYSCPTEGLPKRNRAATLSTVPVHDGNKNAKSIWVRASTSVSCDSTCSFARSCTEESGRWGNNERRNAPK